MILISLEDNNSMMVMTVTLVCVYVALVRLCRYSRERNHKQLINDRKESLEACRDVFTGLSYLEFPLVYRLSLEFALFRTYAIPSISGLLESTQKFCKFAGTRYDDTDLLISEILGNPLNSERSETALKRLNMIHGQFSKQISNDDMIYVLAMFILEPIRWIQEFEWRSLNDAECEGLFRLWCHVGDRMGIDHIPPSLSLLRQWVEAYEAKNMVYAPSNVVIGDATVALFLQLAPTFAHPLGKKLAYCLMDSRLRQAFQYPDPIPALQVCILSMLQLRKFILRYLLPPRPQFLQTSRLADNRHTVPLSQRLCPRFHVYEPTYAQDGYTIGSLGNAPKNKLMQERPQYTKK